MFVDFLTPAIEHSKKAAELDDKKEYAEAAKEYFKAAEYFQTAIRHEKAPQRKDMFRQKCNKILDRYEAITKFLAESEGGGGASPDAGAKGPSGGGATAAGTSRKPKDAKEEDEKAKLKGSLDGAILRSKPNVQWSDVAGLEGAKEALKEAVLLPIQYPQMFTGERKPWKGILLYGPPGTGKSYLAKATATESDATFFSVSAADLMSKWLGESEKLVRSLFEMAREAAPSIVFIDEVDSVCGSRADGDSDSTRRVKTEFLVQMDGVGHGASVLVLGATNTPWSLDAGIRRRFERRVYIPLPDQRARALMFKLHVGKTPHDVTEAEFHQLGAATEGFSGADINIMVRAALMEPIRKLQWATHFRYVAGPAPTDPTMYETDLVTPCGPRDEGAFEALLKDIPPAKLVPPRVSMRDFHACLATSKPSVSPDDLAKQEEFTRNYGVEGS